MWWSQHGPAKLYLSRLLRTSSGPSSSTFVFAQSAGSSCFLFPNLLRVLLGEGMAQRRREARVCREGWAGQRLQLQRGGVSRTGLG